MATQLKPGSEQGIDCSKDEWQARLDLAACYRIFDHLGWSESIYNHISVKVPGEDTTFLINPFGLLYDEVTASNLVKIDVEGHEPAVFEGLQELLQADSELVVCVELHPHRADPADLRSVVDAVTEAGFELVHAASSADSDIPDYDAVKRHLGTREGRHTVDLVAKRARVEAAVERTASGPGADAPSEAPPDGIRRGDRV